MSDVSVDVMARAAEMQQVAKFLTSAQAQPCGLIIEGEAGIGKTTLWLAAVEEAGRRGFRVLSARVGQSESVLAYAALADLLRGVEPEVCAELPDVQRLAIDRVLLRADGDQTATDQRVAAAALVSVIERLVADTPVLVAIDDVQWLDPSSRTAVSFAARRLNSRVGVLVTERCEPEQADAASWLKLTRPDGMSRIRLRPLTLGGIHRLVADKLGRSFARPTMVRIADISGGNPLYALELARAMDRDAGAGEPGLPGTLAELVRMRIGRLEGGVRDVLLAAACAAAPTVELLAQVNDTTAERCVELLEGVEADGIIGIEGNRVQFSHPLLARGVYADAPAARRRAMHRALATVESLPELHARHLALAATSADDATLAALDGAAEVARTRGAPAAAAELLNLAIKLGGDTSYRRVRAAGDHFRAGDSDQARALLDPIMERLRPSTLRAIALNLLAAMSIYDNNFDDAIGMLTTAAEDAKDVAPVLVQTLMSLSFAQGSGAFAKGAETGAEFEESLRNAARAVDIAEEFGFEPQISQALAMWVLTKSTYGHGVDEDSLRRALALEDPGNDVPITFSASAVHALVRAWAGRLDEGRTLMQVVRNRCLNRGDDQNMMAVAGYSSMIEMWRGNFSAAAAHAEEAVERAQQLGGRHVEVIPLSVRGAVAAYRGRLDDARADAAAALRWADECDAPRMTEWPLMTLGFTEVSLGNYAAALAVLQPLLSRFSLIPGTEIMTAWYVPDAVEAMVSLGQRHEAEPLIDELESNGRSLDRPWMLAVGARCRGMLLAAGGDLEAATAAVNRALAEHERLPMPFERARTQVLLGQLQRRQRQKQAAAATFTEALEAFERMGSPVWAERARAELTRTNATSISPTQGALTRSEQRVAELAASGMTTRDVAAALFVSPKTVEANLTQIYRKLGIRSRAELGRLIDQLGATTPVDSRGGAE